MTTYTFIALICSCKWLCFLLLTTNRLSVISLGCAVHPLLSLKVTRRSRNLLTGKYRSKNSKSKQQHQQDTTKNNLIKVGHYLLTKIIQRFLGLLGREEIFSWCRNPLRRRRNVPALTLVTCRTHTDTHNRRGHD